MATDRLRRLSLDDQYRFLVGIAAWAGLLLLFVAALLPFRSESHVGAIALAMLIPPLVAAAAGLRASIIAAIVSGLVFNFFFTQPYDSLRIRESASVAAFAVYLIVSLTLAVVANRMREAQALSERRARDAALVQSVTVEMIRNAQLPPTLRSALVQVVDAVGLRGAALRVMLGGAPIEATAGHASAAQALARSLVERRDDEKQQPRVVALREPGRPSAIPIATTGTAFGFLVADPGTGALDDDQFRTLESFAGVIALALGRAELEEEGIRRRALEETDKLRTALLQSVSHDLRTPLTAIKASASALRQAPLGADERDAALADVEDEADRLARLVGNLLDLSRIESGSLELRRSTVPMDELVFGAIEAAATRTQGHVVAASVPDGATVVTTDEPMIRQVLANLLENAAQHDRSDQPIRVEASLHPRRLELRVVDHGVGVPEAERQRIFEPYQRLKLGTQRKAGTGLGLVICRGFVEALGGTIRLETTAGGGATFVVSVPTEVVP